MIKFKSFVCEEEDLDIKYLKQVEKCSKFNIKSKEYETLDHKREIQHLFAKTWFPSFDLDQTIRGAMDLKKFNKLVDELRKINGAGLLALHKYVFPGVGPGEVLMYFLLDKAHLGGGSSAGVDLVIGSKKFEVKAVTVSKDGYASNFKLGGTFSIAHILTGIQELNVKIGGKKGSSEIGKQVIEKIRKKFPKELKKLETEFRNVSYKNYFSKEEIIFVDNTRKAQIGNIIAIKQVKKNEIFLERVTSGTIKPTVKL